MSHLSRDRLLDAVEGRLDGPDIAHLRQCPRCRSEVEGLAATLKEVRGIEVPEPSPLFWDYLSARVRDAIATEPAPRDRPARWWTRAPARLVAVAAVLLLASMAVLLTPGRWRPETPRSPGGRAAAHTVSTESFELASGDGWDLIVGAAGDVDWDAVEASGIDAGPGTVDAAISELSRDERRELVRLLNEALAVPAAAPRAPKGDV